MNVPRYVVTAVLCVYLMLMAVPCLVLACPPYNLRMMALVGLSMCCYGAMQFKRGLYPAFLGIAVGISMGAAILGPAADFTAYANMLPIFGTVGLSIGASCWLSCWASRRLPIRHIWWFIPTAAVAVEYLCINLFPVSLALTQHTAAWASVVASVFGQWGITWILWLGAACLAVGISERHRLLLAVGFALFVITSLPIKLPLLSANGPTGVAAVQEPGERSAADTTNHLPKNVKYVVWPEQVQLDWDDTAYKAARSSHKYIIGSYMQEYEHAKPTNSVRLYSPSGKVIYQSAKHHLFGKEVFTYRKGSASPAVYTEGGVRVAAPICFDMVYPDVARRLVQSGANLLMVPNSDPDSPNKTFHMLHQAMVRLRAAENRVPIVWAEVSSYSAIIDATGAVIKRAPVDAETAVWASIKVASKRSLYTRFGDWLPTVCLILVIYVLVSTLYRRLATAVK